METLQTLYRDARAKRLQLLNGGHPREWGPANVHSWSYLWGLADAQCPPWMHELMATADELLGIGPENLRAAADADATDEFTRRILLSAHARPQTEEEETEDG